MSPCLLCAVRQRGLLRGLHGQGEEDWQDVRHEVCEEETENRPQPGKRDQRVTKVSSSTTPLPSLICVENFEKS